MRGAEQASGMNSSSKSLEHFPSGGTMWVMRPSTGVRCVTVCSGRPDIRPPFYVTRGRKVCPITGHEGPEGEQIIALFFLQPRR